MAGKAEVVQRFSEAFAAGDKEAALACLHPEVELLPLRARLEGTSYSGHDGYLQVLALFEQDWADLQLLPEQIDEVGERAFAKGRIRAVGKTSGIQLDVPLVLVYEFRDGLISRLESFDDPEAALRAARGED